MSTQDFRINFGLQDDAFYVDTARGYVSFKTADKAAAFVAARAKANLTAWQTASKALADSLAAVLGHVRVEPYWGAGDKDIPF